METGEIYHLISVGSYGFSIAAFVLAVVLFFRDHILDIFNELSGRTLKKNMERLNSLAGASSEARVKKQDEDSSKAVTTNMLKNTETPGLSRIKYVKPASGQSETEELGETEILFGGSARDSGYARGEDMDIVLTDAASTEELGELDFGDGDPGETVVLGETEELK